MVNRSVKACIAHDTDFGTGRRVGWLAELKEQLKDAFHPLAFDVADRAAAESAIAGLPSD